MTTPKECVLRLARPEDAEPLGRLNDVVQRLHYETMPREFKERIRL